MAKQSDEDQRGSPASRGTRWGPKLFTATLIALLLFFYWLLIYSGGVSVYHG